VLSDHIYHSLHEVQESKCRRSNWTVFSKKNEIHNFAQPRKKKKKKKIEQRRRNVARHDGRAATHAVLLGARVRLESAASVHDRVVDARHRGVSAAATATEAARLQSQRKCVRFVISSSRITNNLQEQAYQAKPYLTNNDISCEYRTEGYEKGSPVYNDKAFPVAPSVRNNFADVYFSFVTLHNFNNVRMTRTICRRRRNIRGNRAANNNTEA
jgi:acetolactate synthase regulatory subunit